MRTSQSRIVAVSEYLHKAWAISVLKNLSTGNVLLNHLKRYSFEKFVCSN